VIINLGFSTHWSLILLYLVLFDSVYEVCKCMDLWLKMLGLEVDQRKHVVGGNGEGFEEFEVK